MGQRDRVRYLKLEVSGIIVQGTPTTATECIIGSRAVVQVFEGTSGIDVKKVCKKYKHWEIAH